MLQLNYRDAKPIYEQIKEGIRKLLLTKVIASDEKLPSVRELASNLAINPNTIQRAYKELEAEGYLYSMQGKGTFAAPMAVVQKSRAKELLVSFDDVVSELFVLDVTKEELRQRMDNLEQGRIKTND
ncbi:MAG: GntR family transcriptional regulator [Lachnospiraceae bacterium]|nr:GntR family transcriptional regulator [Lachnospiraceae bacterium]